MDEVDRERFSRAALSSAAPARHVRESVPEPEEAARGRVEDDREELPLGPAGAPQAVRVRGLDEARREGIRQEAQLLASLEVAGVGAAPAVLELEDDGYVRETAPELSRRSGRRVAETTTPPTGERRAVAHAREGLDELIDALHERGWVLAAPRGRGVGARADGSLVVLSLAGLRRDESLAARQEDRFWVDSVLQDQDRTLRRRVHEERGWSGADRVRLVGEPAPPRPAAPDRPSSAPARSEPSARHVMRRSPVRGSAVAARVVRGVLDPHHRLRLALVTGALVLLVGAAVVLGAGWLRSPQAPEAGAEPPTTAAPAPSTSRPAPAIEQPQELVAELAGARHSYVTGMSTQPASAPGSDSLAEDEAVRAAYGGISVRSGGPVVHSAEVVGAPDPEGAVELHAVTSMQELELEQSDGTRRTVPATDPVAVRLVLVWDGTQWLLEEVAPLPVEDQPDGA